MVPAVSNLEPANGFCFFHGQVLKVDAQSQARTKLCGWCRGQV